MSDLVAWLAIGAIVLGTLFSVVGVVGFVRLPDIYTRLHATGKVSVFGVSILLLGAKVLDASGIGKAIVLIAFLVLAGPVLSHAIAAAARRSGVPMKDVTRPGPDVGSRGIPRTGGA